MAQYRSNAVWPGLAHSLKAARERARKTQSEAAIAIGVNLSTLSSWERGLTDLKVSQLAALAKFYGVSVNQLLVEKC